MRRRIHPRRKATLPVAAPALLASAMLLSACSHNDGAGKARPPGADAATGAGDVAADVAFTDTPCAPPAVTMEATRKAGPQPGASPWPAPARLLPGGRMLTPAGTQTVLGGFPIDVVAYPDGLHAVVLNTGYALRAVQLLRLSDGALVDAVQGPDFFKGLAVDAFGTIWAAGGDSGLVQSLTVSMSPTARDPERRQFKPGVQLEVGGYPAGLSVAADGKELRVAQMLGKAVVFVRTTDGVKLATTKLKHPAYGLLELPAGNGGVAELAVAGFGSTMLSILDLQSRQLARSASVGSNPHGMAVSSDGSRLWVALSDQDELALLDRGSLAVLAKVVVGEADVAGADGPLPASSASALLFDESRGLLLLARAADNMVDLRQPDTLERVASVPVGWYPTGIAVGGDGSKLVVSEGKGVGTGPIGDDDKGKAAMQGAATIVDLDSLDFKAATARADLNTRRPDAVLPFACKGVFPVPSALGGPTPIKRVVLIVRENKTYDAALGDLPGADGDPNLVLWGPEVTPNLHALAKAFVNHDNFYSDAESSVQGHLWLTSSFVNDYMERTWLETYRGNAGFATDAVGDKGQPDFGTFFTHLLRHGVDFRVFGQVVGSAGKIAGETGTQRVLDRIDTEFPGVFYNMSVPDVDKAAHVIDRLVVKDDWPPFVYILLPNDHTYGKAKGQQAPASMVHDNDVATGMIVDALSKSPHWHETAVFITQDDSQQGGDHVDYHRSVLVVASPYAKRGHVSHVHASFPSLFRTFELILGLPAMNRYDALATPLWDAFTMEASATPYDHQPRTLPLTFNGGNDGWMTLVSSWMDFRGPDRNPDLSALLQWLRLGVVPASARIAPMVRGEAPWLPPPGHEAGDGDDDDDEERDRFDRDLAFAKRALAELPKRRVCWDAGIQGCAEGFAEQRRWQRAAQAPPAVHR